MSKISDTNPAAGNQPAYELNQSLPSQMSEQARAYAKAEQARRATERRNRIAEGFAFALVSQSDDATQWNPQAAAEWAVQYADALIAELDQ